MMIEIGFATAADLPYMADLLAELFTLESDFKPDREKQISGLRTILDEPELGKLFVLRVDGKVVLYTTQGDSWLCHSGTRHTYSGATHTPRQT